MENDRKPKSLDTGWKFNGGIWTFVDLVKCSLVLWKMRKDDIIPIEERGRIMSDPDLLNAKAEEYGMNEYSISKEMVRIGKDIIDLIVQTQIAVNEGRMNLEDYM